MKCAALSDNIIHRRSLVLLGAVLQQAQRPQEALHHLDHARTMLKLVGNNPSLAYACQVIFWVHYNVGRLPEALDAIEEAWEHAQLTENVSIQAEISGRFLFNANRDAEAWEYIEISLMKASYVGNRFTVAQALEYMGYGYLRRGDYQNAYGAYEAAAETSLVLSMSILAGGTARITWPGSSRSKRILAESSAFIGMA